MVDLLAVFSLVRRLGEEGDSTEMGMSVSSFARASVSFNGV